MKLLEPIVINLNDLKTFESPFNDLDKTKTSSKSQCDDTQTTLVLTGDGIGLSVWGQIDQSLIHIPIYLTQKFDDIGIFTDFEVQRDLEPYLTNVLFEVTGATTQQLSSVKAYNGDFVIGLNLSENPTQSFDGVLEKTTEYIVYVIGGEVDNLLYVPNTGVIYKTYLNDFSTTFTCISSGVTEDNVSIAQIVKQDLLLGIVQTYVQNDIYVDRGQVSINESHQRLSEIQSVDDLTDYVFGFYRF